MKRSALAAALLITLAAPGAAAARPSDVMESARFAVAASGATVMDGGGTRLLLDLEDKPKTQYTFGSGAASLFVVPTADGGTQKAIGHAYYERRSLRVRLAYTVAAADADNVSAINGTGTLRGSGRVRGTFAVTGSQDGSGLLKLQLAGKVPFPVPVVLSGRGH